MAYHNQILFVRDQDNRDDDKGDHGKVDEDKVNDHSGNDTLLITYFLQELRILVVGLD